MKNMSGKPSISLMKQHLRYDADTGFLWWIKSGHGRDLLVPIGESVEFMGKMIRCSIVGWAFTYGEWPDRYVVHLNGVKSDNRICNLKLYEHYRSPVKKAEKLTNAEILESFEYDHETGVVYAIICGERVRKEKLTTIKNGTNTYYFFTNHKSNTFLSHRLAWFLYHKKWPEHDIDHINHDGCDNRIVNLRDVSRLENLRNSRRSKRNKSGVTGVCFHKVAKKWCAQIAVNGVVIYLGLYDKIEDAAAARLQAEKKHGFHPNHGRIQ